MMKGKIIHEADSHFVVDDGTSTFKVAKANLRHSTVEKLRKHFSEGGTVKQPISADDADPGARDVQLPSGGSVAPDPAANRVYDDGTGADLADTAALRAKIASDQATADRYAAEDARQRAMNQPAIDAAEMGDVDREAAARMRGPEAVREQNQIDLRASMGDPDAIAAKAAALPAHALTQGDMGTPNPPDQTPPAVATPPAVPATEAQFGAPTGTAAADSAEQSAVRGMASAQAATLAKQAAILERQRAHDAEMEATAQKIHADNTAQVADATKYLSSPNSNINPNSSWQNRSSIGKAGAIIGLILSGIGSGLTGRPNMAMEMLDKESERDIEAQKLNLGKKESVLSRLMQQGHDIESSQALARAARYNANAKEIEENAAASGSQEVMQRGNMVATELRRRAIDNTQLATSRGMANADAAIRLRNAQANQPIEAAKREAWSRIYGVRLPGGGGAVMGPATDSDYAKVMPAEQMATTVSGARKWAGSEQNAKTVNENTAASMPLRWGLTHMRSLLAKGSVLSLKDRAEAAGVQRTMLDALNSEQGLKRYNPEHNKELANTVVPNVDDLMAPLTANTKLNALQDLLDNKDSAVEGTFLPNNQTPFIRGRK